MTTPAPPVVGVLDMHPGGWLARVKEIADGSWATTQEARAMASTLAGREVERDGYTAANREWQEKCATLAAQLAEVTAERDRWRTMAINAVYALCDDCLHKANVRPVVDHTEALAARVATLIKERDEEQRVVSIMLRQRDKATEERDMARGQRDKLAEAIVDIATSAGIPTPGVAGLSGAHVLMLADYLGVTLRGLAETCGQVVVIGGDE